MVAEARVCQFSFVGASALVAAAKSAGLSSPRKGGGELRLKNPQRARANPLRRAFH